MASAGQGIGNRIESGGLEGGGGPRDGDNRIGHGGGGSAGLLPTQPPVLQQQQTNTSHTLPFIGHVPARVFKMPDEVANRAPFEHVKAIEIALNHNGSAGVAREESDVPFDGQRYVRYSATDDVHGTSVTLLLDRDDRIRYASVSSGDGVCYAPHAPDTLVVGGQAVSLLHLGQQQDPLVAFALATEHKQFDPSSGVDTGQVRWTVPNPHTPFSLHATLDVRWDGPGQPVQATGFALSALDAGELQRLRGCLTGTPLDAVAAEIGQLDRCMKGEFPLRPDTVGDRLVLRLPSQTAPGHVLHVEFDLVGGCRTLATAGLRSAAPDAATFRNSAIAASTPDEHVANIAYGMAGPCTQETMYCGDRAYTRFQFGHQHTGRVTVLLCDEHGAVCFASTTAGGQTWYAPHAATVQLPGDSAAAVVGMPVTDPQEAFALATAERYAVQGGSGFAQYTWKVPSPYTPFPIHAVVDVNRAVGQPPAVTAVRLSGNDPAFPAYLLDRAQHDRFGQALIGRVPANISHVGSQLTVELPASTSLPAVTATYYAAVSEPVFMGLSN